MKIETLPEWNEVAEGCNCCPMPLVPEITHLYSDLRVFPCGETIDSQFYFWLPGGVYYASEGFDIPYCEDQFKNFRSVVYTQTTTVRSSGGTLISSNDYTSTKSYAYTGSASSRTCQATVVNTGTLNFPVLGVFSYAANTVSRIAESTDPYTGQVFRQSNTWVYSDPCGFAEVVTELAVRTNWIDRDDMVSEFDSKAECKTILESLKKARYQWRISNSHLGIYFKITWDIATEPDEGAATLEEGLVWEWTGPGTGGSSDPSWLSSQYTLLYPDAPGVRKVVNVRYVGYRSTRMGIKPQLIGDGYILPPNKPSVKKAKKGKDGSTGKDGSSKIDGGKSGSNGLKIGGLRVGGLKMTGLKTSGLKIGGLKINSLQMGSGLRFSSLESSGGLKSSGLRFNSLESSGGLKTSGLRVSGLQSSSGIRVSGIQTSRLQSSSGLRRSGGLRSSGGLRRGSYSL
jgi:hypothetical protein